MTAYHLPYFGAIDLTDLKDHYRTKTDFANRKLDLDLNFDVKQITPGEADTIKDFLSRIEEWNKQHLVVLQTDFEERTGETFGYLEEHFEYLYESELEDAEQRKEFIKTHLLNELRLVRVGLYPDD